MVSWIKKSDCWALKVMLFVGLVIVIIFYLHYYFCKIIMLEIAYFKKQLFPQMSIPQVDRKTAGRTDRQTERLYNMQQ